MNCPNCNAPRKLRVFACIESYHCELCNITGYYATRTPPSIPTARAISDNIKAKASRLLKGGMSQDKVAKACGLRREEVRWIGAL